MAATKQLVALVTGANKGIGYHIVDQLARSKPPMTVLLGARDPTKGAAAVKQLGHENVHSIRIDIDDEASIDSAVEEVKQKYGGLDILVNNAGIVAKGDAFDENVVKTTFHTNYYGTLHCCRKFLPILRPNGRIINVSSANSIVALHNMSEEKRKQFLDPNITVDQLTQLLEQFRQDVAARKWEQNGWPKAAWSTDEKRNASAYDMSKVGVSILTRALAREMTEGRTINSGCPGYCETDLNSGKGTRSAAHGASNFSHLALLPHAQLTNGEFWEDSQVSSLTRPI